MEGESTQPADISSGMIMKVLRDNPMKTRQSAIYMAGVIPEYPSANVLCINSCDFNYFAEQIISHSMRLVKIKDDENGNPLYAIEDGHPLIVQ